MHCNSQAPITKIKSENFNEKRRHVTVRNKSIRYLISHGVIFLDFVKYKNYIANLISKGLICQQVIQSSRQIELEPLN